MPGGNVNGVTIASAASAVAVFSGSDIGVGGFVDAPSLSYNFGVAPPDGSYTVGLINHGIIQVVAGTDVNANGLYGPGNYLLEVPQGSVYVQYSHGIAGATVYIDNASGGFTYLTNTRSIAGLAQIRTVGGPASVNNSGFIGGVALSGGSGTLQNSGVIAGYSDAVAGDFDILNTGLLYATATVGVGGQLLTNTSGTVTNQGTILGDVQAGARGEQQADQRHRRLRREQLPGHEPLRRHDLGNGIDERGGDRCGRQLWLYPGNNGQCWPDRGNELRHRSQ